jgi:hypothetical protein
MLGKQQSGGVSASPPNLDVSAVDSFKFKSKDGHINPPGAKGIAEFASPVPVSLPPTPPS